MGFSGTICVDMFDLSGVIRNDTAGATLSAIEGATVSFGLSSTTTNSDGEYRLSALGCEENTFKVTYGAGEWTTCSITSSFPCAQYNTADFNIQKKNAVSGFVYDINTSAIGETNTYGTGLSGALVVIKPDGLVGNIPPPAVYEFTDADGNFETIPDLPGEGGILGYSVEVSAAGYTGSSSPSLVSGILANHLVGSSLLKQHFGLYADVHLNGTIKRKGSVSINPLAGASVVLSPLGTALAHTSSVEVSATADVNGDYTFDDLDGVFTCSNCDGKFLSRISGPSGPGPRSSYTISIFDGATLLHTEAITLTARTEIYNTFDFIKALSELERKKYFTELEPSQQIFKQKGKSSIRWYLNSLQKEALAEAAKNTTTIYKHTLRALLKEFGELKYSSSEHEIINVRCIHANPERAVAKIFQEDNIVIPIMSISQLFTSNDEDRRRYDSLMLQESIWDEDSQRAIRVISTVPRPINISYGLNIWTKYMSDMDQLSEQIRLRFNPGLETIITPYNSLTKAFLASETDGRVLQTGDREDRIIQKTFQIDVETYANPAKFLYSHTGKIEAFRTEVGLGDDSGEDIVID